MKKISSVQLYSFNSYGTRDKPFPSSNTQLTKYFQTSTGVGGRGGKPMVLNNKREGKKYSDALYSKLPTFSKPQAPHLQGKQHCRDEGPPHL